MSSYKITKYTKDRAKELGVKIRVSSNPNKKIDVFDKNGKKICSIGAINYSDYPTMAKTDYWSAHERRRLYHIRHAKDIAVVNSCGYYAGNLLW